MNMSISFLTSRPFEFLETNIDEKEIYIRICKNDALPVNHH